MGQTVRNQGPYDRLWMPGVPHNRSEKPERSKIEYLDDRRKAKAAQAAGRQDALAYDSNFRKAAAVHGERGSRQHFLKDTSTAARPRPQGVGGRQQTPPGARHASGQLRGQQERAAAARPAPSGKAAAAHPRPRPQPGAAARPRPSQTARPRSTAAQPQPRQKADAGSRQPRSTAAQPQPRPKPDAGSRQPRSKTQPQRPQTGGSSRQRQPGRSQTAVRAGERPQRDTVTDFRSVEPGPQARRQPAPPKSGKKKNNGHGRKLTPTYELKARAGSRPKQQGSPIVEGGVVGFDMGAYGREAAAPSAAARPMKPSSVVSTILTIAICFVLLTAVLAGQARLANYSQQNAALEKSIADMEENISKLKMQIALEEDLGNIQERAAALGLGSPDDSQIQYVDLSATDEVKEMPSIALEDHQSDAADSLVDALVLWFETMFGSTPSAGAGEVPATPADG